MPVANQNTATTGDVAQYSFIKQEDAVDNFVTFRIDHKLTARDNIYGTYLYDDNPFTIGDAENLTVDSSKTRRQDLILEENHVFSSSFINSLRFGLNRQAVSVNQGVQVNPTAADTSLGAIPGRTAPGVTVSGLTTIAGGLGSSPTYFFRFTTFQATTMHFSHLAPTL